MPWGLVLALAIGVACDRPAAPLGREVVAVVAGVDTVRVQVEVAETTRQRNRGLMDRDSVPPQTGMLFEFGETRPPDAGFWMWRTRVPLDIAFLDADGRIVALREMEPCPHEDPDGCPQYAPGTPYRAALEVAGGSFRRWGVRVGDVVVRGLEATSTGPECEAVAAGAAEVARDSSVAAYARWALDRADEVSFPESDVVLLACLLRRHPAIDSVYVTESGHGVSLRAHGEWTNVVMPHAR